jgi:hypothetical protein
LPLMDRNTGRLSRCPDARALLPAYVEDELEASERRRVAGHLELCSACRAEEAQYRGALGLLGAPREPLRPERDLYAGFAAKLERYERKSYVRQRQLRWAGSFACLLLVVTASASWLRSGQLGKPTVLRPNQPIVTTHNGNLSSGGDRGSKPRSLEWVTVLPEDPSKASIEEAHGVLDESAGSEQGTTAAAQERKPTPRRERRTKPRRRPNVVIAQDFLDVAGQTGTTARNQLQSARQGSGATGADQDGGQTGSGVASVKGVPVATDEPRPNVPGMTYYEREAEQRLRVGGAVTRLSRARGYNREGDLVLVKVNIGTTNKTEPGTDSSIRFSGEDKQ